jgi:glycosyltransferase involved in cell wall biosynthesis
MKPKIAIIQRVCTNYRKGLFAKLSALDQFQVKIFIGDDVANSKTKNAKDLSGLDLVRLPTRHMKLGSRELLWHQGLLRELERFQPDALLCEGNSNLLSFLLAKYYRWSHPEAALIQWSLGGLPGERETSRFRLKSIIRRHLRSGVDGFLLYSSFARDVLNREGVSVDKMYVAVNVSDTKSHLERAAAIQDSPAEARNRLGLPERFTVLYVGEVEPGKRLEQLLAAAQNPILAKCSFLIVGDGCHTETLRLMAREKSLTNVIFTGKVEPSQVPLYYKSSDVFVLPGLGGMVISEAMAYGLPVIVFQADGTERDLVLDGKTGIRLSRGDACEISQAIKSLLDSPDKGKVMGAEGRKLIIHSYSSENMVKQICHCLEETIQRRHSSMETRP